MGEDTATNEGVASKVESCLLRSLSDAAKARCLYMKKRAVKVGLVYTTDAHGKRRFVWYAFNRV